MKSQKLYKPRLPWWAFDFQNERKGFWRKLHNKLARRRGNEDLRQQVKDIGIMGVDGIDKADIFDEYFDDDKPKVTNFEKITTNASELAIAIMGTDVLANIQKRTLVESIKERLTNDEVLKRNIEYFKQWLESEVRE